MAKALADKGPQGVVLTGIHRGSYIGNFIYDHGRTSWVKTKKIGSDRSGTGDVFTAIVSASVVRGEGLEEAVQKAATSSARSWNIRRPSIFRTTPALLLKNI